MEKHLRDAADFEWRQVLYAKALYVSVGRLLSGFYGLTLCLLLQLWLAQIGGELD